MERAPWVREVLACCCTGFPAGGAVEVLIAAPGRAVLGAERRRRLVRPQGRVRTGEDPLDAAYREFEEETGLDASDGQAASLGELRQPGGKRVSVWALEGDLDAASASSNTFEIEWPRGSGRMRKFPEVDRVEWAGLARRARSS